MNPPAPIKSGRQTPEVSSAFSLVEVVLALGVAVFALFTLMALLPVGLRSERISAEETAAMNLLRSVRADLRSVPAGAPSTVILKIVPTPEAFAVDPMSMQPALVYVGTGNTLLPSPVGALYAIRVSYFNSGAGSSAPIGALVSVQWPAGSPGGANRVESYVALPR